MEPKTRGARNKIDRLEQLLLLLFYLYFLWRLLTNGLSNVTLYLSLMIVSESIVVVLLLIRRPTDIISNRFRDWFLAFSGSFLPLMISQGGDPLMPRLGVLLILWGLLVHISAKLSLLRSFGVVPADRGIKVNGLYAFVRHPMYAGYFLTHLGFLIAAPSSWNALVYTCCWGFLLSRIFLEEQLLLQSSEYRAYSNRVRYRLIPGLF
jgi:protein-S-isoprenylcysteine O-methyltransferase Ste14